MDSDFPLDYDGIRDLDNLDCLGDLMESDDDDLTSGVTQGQEESISIVLPTLKLGTMQLSSDETKDKEFLRSVCMDKTTLDLIDYRFENRGATRGISLCLLSSKLTDLQQLSLKNHQLATSTFSGRSNTIFST
jgi:hypothetical protein